MACASHVCGARELVPEDAVSGIEFQLPAEVQHGKEVPRNLLAVFELLVVLQHGFRDRSLLFAA